jgi:anti-sigma-K factor RskA
VSTFRLGAGAAPLPRRVGHGMTPPSEDTSMLVERLIRIEVMLETELRSMTRQLADHEERLRKSEQWRYALPVSAIAAVASAIAAVVAALGR